MNYTKNYQLNQWDAGDRVLREDFNEDNRKIEEALGEMPKIILGTYTGTGTYGSETPTSLTFDSQPCFIAVFNISGGYQLLCPQGATGANTSSTGHSYGNLAVTWSENTISWYTTNSGSSAPYQMNSANTQYIYLAIA